jgi:hypothetical protein
MFPQTQYGHLVAAFTPVSTCTAIIKADSFSPVDRNLPCIYNTVKKQFELTVFTMASGGFNPHTIILYNIQNPSAVGGSGYFRMETRRNLANLLDFNYLFNQIGFVAAPIVFTGITATITLNPYVNMDATYNLVFTSSISIPTTGSLVLIFPSTLYVKSNFGCTATLPGGVTAGTCALKNTYTVYLTV